MFSSDRRRFLQASTAGIACSANFAFGRFLSAQTYIQPHRISSGVRGLEANCSSSDLSKSHVVEINWQDNAPVRVLSSVVLTGDDLKAFNSFDAARRVVPRNLDKPSITGGRAKLEVPARSYAVIQWGA